MRRRGWFVGALAVLLLAAPAALSQEEGAEGKAPKKKRPAKKKAGLRGEYAMIAKILKLDEETKAKFEEAVKAGNTAMREWRKGDGAKLREIQAAMRKARKAKDQAKVKELNAQLKELNAARLKLMADNKAKIMELLTDEQKVVWEGFTLRRSLMRRLRGIKLSDDQKQQLQTLCEEKAKTMPAASDPKGREERYKAMQKLYAEIAEKILTDEQRERFKKTQPRRKPTARKERPKKEKVKKGAKDF